MYYYLAHGQSEDITHRQKGHRRHYHTTQQRFGNESPLTTTLGRIPWDDIWLLDKRQSKNINVWILNTLTKCSESYPKDMNGSAKTPASGHLFNVSPDASKLPEATAQIFHHRVENIKILNLPSNTSTAVHKIVLDKQSYSTKRTT